MRDSTSSLRKSQVSISESDKEILSVILDKILEGTCRPLRLRIEQVLASQSPAILSYKISNLINFYAVIINKIMLPTSQLSLCLKETIALADKSFYDTLNSSATFLLQSVREPTEDLLPPTAVKENLVQLVYPKPINL